MVKSLIIKYPPILSKSQDEIKQYFATMKSYHIHKDLTMELLFSTPKLISIKNLDAQIQEVFFLFQLYHNINKDKTLHIFKQFPYLFCLQPRKLERFLSEFRKYRFSKRQIINTCAKSGGLLACKINNFVGLFDTLRTNLGMKASDVVKIID